MYQYGGACQSVIQSGLFLTRAEERRRVDGQMCWLIACGGEPLANPPPKDPCSLLCLVCGKRGMAIHC